MRSFIILWLSFLFNSLPPQYGDLRQGEVKILTLPADALGRSGSCKAYFDNVETPVFNYGGRKYILVAADLGKKPGVYPLRVTVGRRLWYEIKLSLTKGGFETGLLRYDYVLSTLPPLVRDSITLAKKPLLEAINESSGKQLWSTGFGYPLRKIRVESKFGRTRIYNNDTTKHRGVDLKGTLADSVYAISEAEVLWGEEREFYSEGKIVVLDHGQGVVSMYMHLSKVYVRTGEVLAKGAVLGRVGATGKGVTGTHLHFTVKVGKAFVDPLKFIESFRNPSR